jgi:hypothetical protein
VLKPIVTGVQTCALPISDRGFMYVNNGVGHREGEIDTLLTSYAPGSTRLYARGISGRSAVVLVSHA